MRASYVPFDRSDTKPVDRKPRSADSFAWRGRGFGTLLALATALGGGWSASAAAADKDPTKRPIETRQGLMKLVGSYFGPIAGMARGRVDYDAAVVQRNATKISQLADMIPDVFRRDTRGSSVPTEALDPIWENMTDFTSLSRDLVGKATALAQATGEGQGAAMAAFRETGGACKACHDEYREQD